MITLATRILQPVYQLQDQPAEAAPAPLLTRDALAPEETWDLSRLYPGEGAFEADFDWLKENYPRLEDFRGTLAQGAAQLKACLDFNRELDLKIERLHHFTMLRVSEDGANPDALNRQSRLVNLLTKIGETTSFIQPEILSIPEPSFQAMIEDPALEEWRDVLTKLQRYRPHTLSGAEERLLAMASGALDGNDDAFSQLTNVDFEFGELEDESGRCRTLTQGSFSSFLQSQSPEVRRQAFHQFYAVFDDHKHGLAAIYANSVKTDVFLARARNYPSARESALFPDALPAEVYDNLMTAVRGNLDPLFRYFELRRQVLGLEEIHHYDTYVPLVAEIKTDYPYEEAVELLRKALQPMGDDYVQTLTEGLLKGRWVDRYETKGKRSGAFSSSSYGNPPYILMNYKPDVFSDVYTLAHEAGHSMHTYYSQQHQRFQDYNYPIFLAEVASTFNEELLTHYLLETTDDPKMRAYIINRQIDDIRGTMIRQTMFAEFEKRAHELEEAGEPLTLSVFREVYRELLNTYFGPDFAIDEVLELECLRIPHFYRAFYVFKYATGIAAATALSQRVINGGEQELRDYLGFLQSGGHGYPLDTLKAAGVDMSTPEPVEATLQLFAQRVDELSELLGSAESVA